MKINFLIVLLILLLSVQCVLCAEDDILFSINDSQNNNYKIIKNEKEYNINKFDINNSYIANFEIKIDEDFISSAFDDKEEILFISGHTDKIYAINTIDMTELWSYEIEGEFYNLIIDSNNNIYTYNVGNNEGKFIAINSNGTEKWIINSTMNISINYLVNDEKYLFVNESNISKYIETSNGNMVDEIPKQHVSGILIEKPNFKKVINEEKTAYSVVYVASNEPTDETITTTSYTTTNSNQVNVISNNEKIVIIGIVVFIGCLGFVLFLNKRRK